MRELSKNEWYGHFIDELKAILSEGRFSVNIETLKTKWELGKRIVEEELNFKKAGYGDKIVETVSKELDISDSTLWRCIQFYNKFPQPAFEGVVGLLGEGKTPSWFKVCTEILPERKDLKVIPICEHNNLMCLKCRKRFTKEEVKNII